MTRATSNHRPSVLLLLVCGGVSAARAQSSPAPTVAVQEQITVTATRASSPLGEEAKTVYELPYEALHEYPATTLDEALRQHPGFELFRRAPSRVANPTSEGISLRGLGSTAASRTLVLEDGAPLNDPFGGYVHWSEQPSPSIQSVTLVTGGGSDLYGSSALGGVIDIVPVVPSVTATDVSLLGGSQATSDLSALSSFRASAFSGLGAGESLRSGGYVVTAPSVAGAADTPANVLSQSYRTELGRRVFPTKRLLLTGNLLNETRDNGTPLQTNATRLWRYLSGYETPEASRLSSRVHLFGSDLGYRQSLTAINASRSAETLTRLLRIHAQEIGATVDATIHLGPFAAVLGGDARDIRATDLETPLSAGQPNGLYDVSARQRFFGAFAELLGSHGGWSGAFSLRGDSAANLPGISLTRSGTATAVVSQANRAEQVIDPRLGITRALGQHAEVHASGFRAFRTPTMNELYRTGQVGQETTLANPQLTSERATGWEAGSKFSWVKYSLQATFFWTAINRPVSAVLLSQTNTALLEMRQNLGQIRSQGVEIAFSAHPTRTIVATAGYQYANAVVTSFRTQPSLVGNWIPQVPRQSFTAQVRATSNRLGEFTLAARASGHSFDDSANQFALAPFFQLDASGERELTKRLAVTFLAQNLTNRRSQVSRTPTLTLGSPIFVEAGLKLHFGRL